ncbi:MAG TPA: protease pro-enzyme activation domain-containing protein [Candidatus Sulfopaludibacter sp.]|jgi:uncharacterized protein (TIGR03437 family)|nr:protease pro-enzyme activation domain-containing protein [Candidatus Sulfopaludibacter sp.]
MNMFLNGYRSHIQRGGLLALSLGVTFSAFAQQPARFRLQGHVHPLATAANDVGRLDPAATISNVTMNFAPTADQQTALDDLLVRQRTPGSPDYQHWLTPDEYADRFGASFADVASVKGWLEAQGFTVNTMARSRTWISFTGTAAQIEGAFQTQMHQYLVNGETHIANASAPSLPVGFSGLVRSVRGLNNFHARPKKRATSRPMYTSSHGNHYISPSDLSTIYNFAPLYNAGIDGTGQKLVIAGQTQINLSDIQHFRSEYGLAAKDPTVLLIPGSQDPGLSTGDVDEAHLDIEWSGAVARNATIEYVYAYDVMNAVQYAIDQNLAPVISTSYGLCEGEISSGEAATMRSWAQQANAQGITWFSASGDSGAADCAYVNQANLAVDIPGSIPEVTSVGGTEFSEGTGVYWAASNTSVLGSANGYVPETSWNDSVQDGQPSASGGGASQFFSKPSWQNVTGVPGDTARHVPDISFSASADHDGYLVYSQGGDYVFGGTSVPTPIYAGLAALLNQNGLKTGTLSTAGLGNLNPKLYSLYSAAPSAFHDITTGDNIVTVTCVRQRNCTSGTVGYSAGPGYDQVTGLGSVDAYVLASAWSGTIPVVTVTTRLGLQSNVGSLSTTDTLSLTATATSSDGSTPSGTVSFNQGSSQLGTAALTGSGGSATATLTLSASKLTVGAGTITATWNGQTASLTVTVLSTGSTAATPVITSVTNAASFTASFAPGAIVSVFGSQLSPIIQVAASVPLPLTISGLSATVNGIAAPLWYISPGQLNIQIPYEVASGTSATLTVNNNGQTASAVLPISVTAPAIFTDTANGLVPYASGARGSVMTLYATGAGLVSPAIATGAAPSSGTAVSLLPAPLQSTTVTVGGVSAPVSFVGIPSGVVGVLQINFQVPTNVAAGSQPVVVTIGTVASKAANLTVQ